MPLHVTTHLNTTPLSTLHIGRLAGGTHPNDINTYAAVTTGPHDQPDFDSPDAVLFTHRYGDGHEICTLKALQAVLAARLDDALADTSRPPL